MKGFSYPSLTAQEAAALVHHGDTVAFSGFSPAGAAKAVPRALADRARREHGKSRPFKLRVLTGASSSRSVDADLAMAKAILWRAPYQGAPELRFQINSNKVEYVDMHLSHLPQILPQGFLGKINLAVVEATEITPDGHVYLSTSIGASPTFLQCADKVIIELNHSHSTRLRELADIVIMPPPPRRHPIPIYTPLTRIGWPYAPVDPKKVIGVVESGEPDDVAAFAPPDDTSRRIAGHILAFLMDERKAGRIPADLLPLQAGVGNLGNGVMAVLGAHPDIPPFPMYTEVLQDAMIDLMFAGKLTAASACSLTITSAKLQQVIDDFDFFASRIVLRPQEISNHPGIIRRLGVVALNTALEFDIYGNVNSSHLFGTEVINGIGGSGEFARNSYLSIFMAPSIAKEGRISTVVPMCPHVDSNEHSVQVVVTEQGLADLRGQGPMQRARNIIDNCSHPLYRGYLNDYINSSTTGHIRHNLGRCFELHRNLAAHGAMLPELFHQDGGQV